MASYGRIAKSGAMWGFVARGMNELVAVPTSMILARMLNPADFGIAAAAAFFIQLAHRLTNFGINTALVQRKDVDAALSSTVFFVNVLAGLVVYLALYFGANPLGRLFNSPEAALVMPVVGLTFLIGPLSSVPTALMTRDLRFRDLVMFEWVATWTTSVSSIALAWFGFGYWSLVYSQVIGVAVPTAGRMFACGWRPTLVFSIESLKQVLGFGMGLHAKRLLDSVAQNIDNLIVGRALGLGALGFYDKAFMMMNRTVVGLSAAGPSVSLRILSIISEDDARFRRSYRKLVLLSTFLAYPVFAGLCVLAPEIFDVMFGSQWKAAVWPFRILCGVGALKFLNAYASTATQARGVVWGEVTRQLGYLLAIVVGAGVGSRFGLVGAATGVLIATILMAVAMHDFLARTTSVSWPDTIATQIPGVACAVGLGVTLLTVRQALAAVAGQGTPSLVGLVVGGVAGAFYMLAFVRLRPFAELHEVLVETVADLAPSYLWLVDASRAGTGRET